MEQDFPDNTTDAAAEGTAAHALAEFKLKRRLKQQAERPVSSYDDEEMEDVTDGYADFVMNEVKRRRNPQVYIERRIDFSAYVPGGFGTIDALIVSSGRVHVIDFKYGRGIQVEAEHNPQLMLYAAGALLEFGGKRAQMTIYQPRRGNIRSFEMTAIQLAKWAEKVLKPKAELAFKGAGEPVTGPWCGFCRAQVKCKARAEEALKTAQAEFKKPDLLTDEELNEILKKSAEMRKWLEAVESYALKEALDGKKWEGMKLVAGRSVRKYTDTDAVIRSAAAAGYTDIYELLSPAKLEKVLGKSEFERLIGQYTVRAEGSPLLVKESDKRPEIPAKGEFHIE